MFKAKFFRLVVIRDLSIKYSQLSIIGHSWTFTRQTLKRVEFVFSFPVSWGISSALATEKVFIQGDGDLQNSLALGHRGLGAGSAFISRLHWRRDLRVRAVGDPQGQAKKAVSASET